MIILKPKKSFLLWLMDKEGTQVVLNLIYFSEQLAE